MISQCLKSLLILSESYLKQYVEDKMSDLRTDHICSPPVQNGWRNTVSYKANTECWKWEGVNEGGSTVY